MSHLKHRHDVPVGPGYNASSILVGSNPQQFSESDEDFTSRIRPPAPSRRLRIHCSEDELSIANNSTAKESSLECNGDFTLSPELSAQRVHFELQWSEDDATLSVNSNTQQFSDIEDECLLKPSNCDRSQTLCHEPNANISAAPFSPSDVDDDSTSSALAQPPSESKPSVFDPNEKACSECGMSLASSDYEARERCLEKSVAAIDGSLSQLHREKRRIEEEILQMRKEAMGRSPPSHPPHGIFLDANEEDILFDSEGAVARSAPNPPSTALMDRLFGPNHRNGVQPPMPPSHVVARIESTGQWALNASQELRTDDHDDPMSCLIQMFRQDQSRQSLVDSLDGSSREDITLVQEYLTAQRHRTERMLDRVEVQFLARKHTLDLFHLALDRAKTHLHENER